jgi:PKD repeat protein
MLQRISFTFLFLCYGILHAQVWKELGPIDFPVNSSGQINGIGRVTQMSFHPTAPHKRYATSASGGLYYTQDTGHHWMRLGTDALPLANLASICVDHTNDQILYMGTGDPNYYGEDYGVYKSTNGGATWVPANNGIANRMAVDLIMNPTNNLMLVAATNNGIWRTTDGGNVWSVVNNGGAYTHMQRVPNTNTLLAVTANQVWRSTDFGASWVLVNNITFGGVGSDGMRVMVNSVSPQIVYVASNGNNGEIYKSVDTGASFANIYSSTTQCLVCYDEDPINAGQGNYNFAACANPNNPNNLYVAAQCLWESNDGGLSWERKTEWWRELHTDHHQFVFDPYQPDKFWSINDGGIWLREGVNDSLWMPMSDGISATEIYKAASSSTDKRLISIGTQDNGEKYRNVQGWFTNRGGDWTSRMLYDYSSTQFVYYLDNGRRRGFSVNTGEVSFNCPFDPTNNARIAFLPQNTNVGLLAKDTLWLSTNLQTANPTWSPIINQTIQIRDLIFSAADSTLAFATHAGKFSRIENIWTTPTATTVNTPSSNGTRGSIASVKNNVNIVYLSCNARVWRSTDKGNTWNNVTYNLPTTNILKMYHDDYSTDERVYVCSGNQIFTKTVNDTVWQNLTGNLPTISNITEFMMVNDSTIASKLRVSYFGRGTWEYKLNPQFPPVADFKASNTYTCTGDTIQFQDLSFEDSLTYQWSFPGGTPAVSTLKNPTVVYNLAGSYAVTLTVSNTNGQHTKMLSNYITVVSNNSSVDTVGPGKAVYLDGSSSSYINVGSLNLNTNNLTLMCWIKPDGAQNDWAGLLFARGSGTTSGLSIKSNNEIRIHWDDDYYGSATNLFAPSNEWSHCALVVTPTEAKVYVNGEEALIAGNFPLQTFDTDMMLGADITSGSRRFKGWMDEAVVYNKALTREEIREQMHLIKYPVLASDQLKGYWQMNTITGSGTTPNSAGCKNQGVVNAFTSIVKSSAPFGIGSSKRLNVLTGGPLLIPEANILCGFPNGGTYPDGEIVVTQLRTNPDEMPGGTTEFASTYWIMDNYGVQSSFTGLDSMLFEQAGHIIGTANEYQLYTRPSNAHGATWGNAMATAQSVVNGQNGSIRYTNFTTPITQAGQYVSKGPYNPVGMQTIVDSKSVYVFPNPSTGIVELRTNFPEAVAFKLSTTQGTNLIYLNRVVHGEHIDLTSLSAGMYTYEVLYGNTKYIGKLQVMPK